MSRGTRLPGPPASRGQCCLGCGTLGGHRVGGRRYPATPDQPDQRLRSRSRCSNSTLTMYRMTSGHLALNGKKLNMEVDTGAALSVISESTRLIVFPKETLHPSNLILNRPAHGSHWYAQRTSDVRQPAAETEAGTGGGSRRRSKSPRDKLANVHSPRLE